MSKNVKMERWRNQTLVNRTSHDWEIANEYNALINYIFENYKMRMETIQNPLLHLISHCFELKYKEVILFALEHLYISGESSDILHTHTLSELSSKFIELCTKISRDSSSPDNDRQLITNKIIPNHQKLAEILKSDVTTYRYSVKYNRNGFPIGRGVPFEEDDESPNIIDIKTIYEDCFTSINYIATILDYMFPDN